MPKVTVMVECLNPAGLIEKGGVLEGYRPTGSMLGCHVFEKGVYCTLVGEREKRRILRNRDKFNSLRAIDVEVKY